MYKIVCFIYGSKQSSITNNNFLALLRHVRFSSIFVLFKASAVSLQNHNATDDRAYIFQKFCTQSLGDKHKVERSGFISLEAFKSNDVLLTSASEILSTY